MSLAVLTKNDVLTDNFLELQKKLFMLRPIHNKRDYNKAMKIVETLAQRDDLTQIQLDYLEILANNLETYEKSHLNLSDKDPIEILQFLLDENGLNGSKLGEILGNRTLGYAILKRQRNLSKIHIIKLAKYFSVSPALFL